ncbi:cobaltochelatase subunit CobN [Leptolyngbya sp. FACHB-17]|uniref:cobaltochelatase subunit CobN n=1 Tax=unclassified Leptolyngbya TaxID=2650499 RepID=UPI0016815432|nr:cobaltochelatase subunit CobN [Leptolyngbya sp. FACHB-17]MBD2083309.1 cobaltochelatase subunit CobN [Leptolyngbya sp. FACHB-17]
MHRIAATPGGWTPDLEGVVFIEQAPAPIVVITAADTDIQTLSSAITQLPSGFPEVRGVNLLQLQQQLTIDTYAEEVLEAAKVIVLRIIGGRSYWSYGLEVVRETAENSGATLIVLPGDDRPDLDLMSHSTVPFAQVERVWRYFNEGGAENYRNALQFLAKTYLGVEAEFADPQVVPRVGLYRTGEQCSYRSGKRCSDRKVGILFYRAHYLSGNTAVIDDLCAALCDRDLCPVPIFVSSLRDPDVQSELLTYFQPKDRSGIDILLNTTSFSLGSTIPFGMTAAADAPELWQTLDIPVLQVILSGGTVEQWQAQLRGLSPRDTAINVALPEVDGRIISRAISFKAVQARHPELQTEVVTYQAVRDRVEFVAALTRNWVELRRSEKRDRKVALILANYPTRDGRLANGVGLDTPASCIEILKALQHEGYTVDNIPENGDELVLQLTRGVTNDPEARELRNVNQSLSLSEYQTYFSTLPPSVQESIVDRWSSAAEPFAIPGIQFGNVFVGIQPARGYDLDPSLNYHAPDLEPTYQYLAFYYWVRETFGAQAIVHVGKHGNLEWLPGKSVALSENCFPEIAIGALPHFYPFIVNDPGEGSQAKRRAQAVILDHLTPPMTRAELYGGLQKLEALIDEYYEAQNLDPSRLNVVRDRIIDLVEQDNLKSELPSDADSILDLITDTDRYLCELKEAQIRDGLHIFGKCPEGRQLRDLIVAIARHPQPDRVGLTRAIAEEWGLDFDPLTADPAERLDESLEVIRCDEEFGKPPKSPRMGDFESEEVFQLQGNSRTSKSPTRGGFRGQNSPNRSAKFRTVGDAIAAIETEAANLVDRLLQQDIPQDRAYTAELNWIRSFLLPALQNTHQEIDFLLHGLNGGYVPAAPSGAPTRGRPEVLPTGRNFYSVDIRSIPTESAWQVGRKAAEAIVERYTQENGEYPRTIGLSIWGTSTMRTGGDDLAEALALLGVQPVWDGISRRVVDFEILPLSVLSRPRVDVTLRISGFFRDAFPNLIDLFDQAVSAIAQLDEPPDQNPLAAQVKQESEVWQAAGLSAELADRRSRHRIFGSKPGAYGAGLQGLIESQNWETDGDLARAYINWSSYAYSSSGVAQSAPEAFQNRLNQMQIVLQNQDNQEHDLLDSDDYYQFQGGLTAAVRSTQGKNPTTYFGDHSLPENPKIRSLKQQIARVYRSRVINPKWIAGAMRHGYKGAFELAATIDFLFAYDATAQCVEDYMYQGVAEAYLFDSTVQNFIQSKNPWALRDMAERLLEANQRGFWQQANEKTLEQLREIVLEAEGVIEGQIS